MSSIFDPEARRFISTLSREWDRYLASLDHDDIDDDPPPRPVAVAPAPTLDNARTMYRYSQEQQDAYSERMRVRYGREY